jgi:hypothetical protein
MPPAPPLPLLELALLDEVEVDDELVVLLVVPDAPPLPAPPAPLLEPDVVVAGAFGSRVQLAWNVDSSALQTL